MKKLVITAALAAFVLAGCEGSTEDEVEVFRLKSVTISDGSTQTGRADYRYTAAGRLDRIVNFDDEGEDAVWGTADDEIEYWTRCSFSGTAISVYRDLSIEYRGEPLAASALADWNSLQPRKPRCADGLVGYSETGERTYEAKGPDEVWLTADDVEDSYRYAFVQNGSSRTTWSWATTGTPAATRIRQFSYETSGSQGTGVLQAIRVAEDSDATLPYEFEGRYRYLFDGSGLLESRVLYDGKGGDNLWGGSDDVVHSRVVLARLSGKTLVRSYDRNNDLVGYYEYSVVDGRLASETHHKPGPDGDYETADDEITVYTFIYERI